MLTKCVPNTHHVTTKLEIAARKRSQLKNNKLVGTVEKKSGQLRICIDPRDLNKVIFREYHHLPTQEEISTILAGAKYFSHLDAKPAF